MAQTGEEQTPVPLPFVHARYYLLNNMRLNNHKITNS